MPLLRREAGRQGGQSPRALDHAIDGVGGSQRPAKLLRREMGRKRGESE
jgi:hypothetical protein